MRRLYIPSEEIGPRIKLKPRDLRYLLRVLRLEPGDLVEVFDGKGNRYKTRIVEYEDGYFLEVLEELEPETAKTLKISLGQGILKGEKMKWVIQKATELGVDKIIPVKSSRSVPFFEGNEAKKKAERWRKIAQEAARQSNRSTVPEVCEPMDLDEFLEQAGGTKLAFWEKAEKRLKEALEEMQPCGEVTLLVGPEGGFSDREALLINREGFTLCQLGERILRAETAALVALTLTQYLYGDIG